jgi:hypothetical protein
MAHVPPRASVQPIDTGRDENLKHVRYEDLLRAIGGYVDQHGLTDVLVTQIPDGVLLKATAIDQSPRGAVERITSVLFTNEDILAILDESMRKRGQSGHGPG